MKTILIILTLLVSTISLADQPYCNVVGNSDLKATCNSCSKSIVGDVSQDLCSDEYATLQDAELAIDASTTIGFHPLMNEQETVQQALSDAQKQESADYYDKALKAFQDCERDLVMACLQESY